MLDRTCPPAIHTIGNLSLPDIHVESLDNGVTLHVYDSGTLEINQLCMIWPGGIIEAGSQALVNLTGALITQGVVGMTAAQLSEAMDFRGALYGNAKFPHYSSLTISSVNNLAQDVYHLFAKIIATPTFEEHTLDVFREKAIKKLLYLSNKVSTLCQWALLPMIYGPNNPMAQVPTVEEYKSITRDDLVRLHAKVYNAKGSHAFLAGRITPEIYHGVCDMLRSLPSHGEPCPIKPLPLAPAAPGEVMVQKDGVLQDGISMFLPAPHRSHPDFLPLRATVIALGGYFGSRLMKNIREDKGYTYGINARMQAGHDGAYVNITTQTDPAYVRSIIDETRKEMIRLGETPLDENELERVKQTISLYLIDTLDSPLSVSEYYQGMLISGYNQEYFDRQVDLAHNLSPDIIMDMARKYLDPTQLRIAIAGV